MKNVEEANARKAEEAIENARKAEEAIANAEKLKSKASKWKVALALTRAVAPTSSSTVLHETGVVNGKETKSENDQANGDNVKTSFL